MKVFNLTDVPTKVLEQHGLVSKHIAVGTRMADPGEYVEVEDTPTRRADLAHLVTVGALSIDSVPPAYTKARGAADASAGKAPIGHVNVRETRVAGELQPDPRPVAGARVELARELSELAPEPTPSAEEARPATPEGGAKKSRR